MFPTPLLLLLFIEQLLHFKAQQLRGGWRALLLKASAFLNLPSLIFNFLNYCVITGILFFGNLFYNLLPIIIEILLNV